MIFSGLDPDVVMPVWIEVTASDGGSSVVTISTDSMELAGEVVQASAAFSLSTDRPSRQACCCVWCLSCGRWIRRIYVKASP